MKNEKLAHSKHTLHQWLVGRVHIGSLAEVALTGLALLGQKVLFEGLGTLDFTRGRYLKSLLCAAVGLELGHDAPFFGTAKVRQ